MNSRTVQRVFLVSMPISAFLLSISWFLARKVDDRCSEIKAVSDRTVRADDQRNRLHGRLASLNISRNKLQSSIAAESAEKRVTPTLAAKPGWFELLRTDPVVQSRYIAYQRSGVIMEYAKLFRALNLSPDQIAQFEDNIMQEREDQMDLGSTLQAKGISTNDPSAEKIRIQQEIKYESAQKNLLGEGGYAQLKAYEQQKPAREMANNIAGAASLNGLEFSADQSKQLTALLDQSFWDPSKQRQNSYRDVDWDKLDEQARAFLTPEQITFIKSAEILGPTGTGSRFQLRLNDLITQAAQEEAKARQTAKAP